jgi:hypothetical protein
LTGKTDKPHMLIEIFRKHNAQMAALVATLTKYTTTLMHTQSFLEWKSYHTIQVYRLQDILRLLYRWSDLDTT